MIRRAPRVAAVVLAALLARPSQAADGWEPAAPDADGDWLATFLDEADFHEEAFNLGAALRRYRQACELTPPAGAGPAWWSDWIEGCEGMVDSAFAQEDWASLDQALRTLLRARPDHPFEPARFAPLVIQRAGELANALAWGQLRIEGPPAAVSLDGQRLGLPPLQLARVPAGDHRIDCGALGRTVTVEAGAGTTTRCPAGAATGPLLERLDPRDPTWIGNGDEEGIEPGVWVFRGGETAVGLRVEPDDDDIARWNAAVAGVRAR
jgi:hypothetical protein